MNRGVSEAELRRQLLEEVLRMSSGWSFEKEPGPLVSALVNLGFAECYDSMFGLDYYHLTNAGRKWLTAALAAEPGAAEGWKPMETAPFDTLVDLWCIQGYEQEATWPVRGILVGDRHKSKDYGWFGNQSKEGVPRGDAPDLVPVAWRPVNVPTDLLAAFLRPAAPHQSGESGK